MVAGHGNLADGVQKSRSERRREDTRRKLMRAAYEIIADKGLEGLVIQEITQYADVGYGTFYNHFPSKEAVVDAVIEAALLRILDRTDRLRQLLPDPAEAFGIDLRMALHETRVDRLWGWFLIRSVLSRGQALRTGVAESLRQSIGYGIASGSFRCDDLEMARHIIGGLMLLGKLNLVSGDMPPDYESRLVATSLKSVGVSDARIDAILLKSYPDLDLPAFLEAADDV
jgi:AcrR family transcriptional regulator